MYRKKSTPIIILLLCWSQTSNSFKLPHWLIPGSIVAIGGISILAQRYSLNFNSLWERLFARSKKPANKPTDPLMPSSIDESTPSSNNNSSDPISNMSLSNRRVHFSLPLVDPKNPNRIECLAKTYNSSANPSKSCLKHTNPSMPVKPTINQSFERIPTSIPADTPNNAVVPHFPGQLRAQQNPNQPNTFFFPPEFLAILGTKGIDPFSPLCIHLFDETQTIIFELSGIHAFPDAIQKSPEALQLLLSAKHLLGNQQANALDLFLKQAIAGTSTENSTTPDALNNQDNNPSTTHRREYSSNPSAYGGNPNKNKEPNAYDGTKIRCLGLGITQRNKNVTFYLGNMLVQTNSSHYFEPIHAYTTQPFIHAFNYLSGQHLPF